ncbi:structural maintenance of chromosomes protein-like protein 5 [Clohesyomyces aquaticus]|uniref:Structural maintenance of chromosomes protein 5 n=1 Tax=Clohesyomyces aquaticus TaxID=1231657 RepID=A0A1Y1ZCD8_9PLEO|nr:structural maintenance of chromosomes protein-like protein 5 [Clohesyomyces aquaticus]
MPGILSKRARDVSDDESDSQAATPSSTGSKRSRYDRDASVESSENSAAANGQNNESGMANGEPSHNDYSEDVHQPGSLVRVKLKNFVTYTAVEFHPGPSLNMIIGPNGTGKSTLVCAICLGLGWSSACLGRAKEVGEFVKHGSAEAEIEIELAGGKKHRTNPIIRRLIRKEGNKSVFFLNGRQSTQKAVVDLAKSFSIQIDNLCQFLPQEKVVDFAKLSPVDMLYETQRAAAPEYMVQWHEELKELRKNEKRLEVEQGGQSNTLKNLQTKQKATREDVERWEQRQELLRKQDALEKCRPVIELRLLRNRCEELKKQKEQAKRELAQLTAEIAPLREAQEDARAYQHQIDSAKATRSMLVTKAKERVDKIHKATKFQQDVAAECDRLIKAERTDYKQRQQDFTRINRKINEIDRAMNEEPVEIDEAKYDADLREIRAKISRIERRDMAIKDEMRTIAIRVNALKSELQTKVDERASLNTSRGQQANKLKQISQDAAQAWEWIQQNKDNLPLKGEVCGPPIITCSVTDPSYAEAIESFVGLGDLAAITCTDPADSTLLSDKILGRQGLGLHNVSIRMVPQPLSFYRSDVSQEELQRLGFQSWMIDLVQGPDTVLAMLCENQRLHRAAYTPRSQSDEQFNAVSKSQIGSWVAGTQRYTIARRYGQSSTRVVDLKRSKFFTNQPVDVAEKRELDIAIQDIEGKIAEDRNTHKTLKEQQQSLKGESDQAKLEKEEIESDKQAKLAARAQWALLPNKKGTSEAEEEKSSMLELHEQTRSRVNQETNKMHSALLKASRLTLEYVKSVAILRQAHENLLEAQVRSTEAVSEVESLEAENADINRELETKKAIYKQLEEEKKQQSHLYNRRARKTQEDINALSDEEREIVTEFSNLPSIEELDAQTDQVNNRLLMMADGNPQAIKQYQKREQEIQALEAKLDTIIENLETTKDKIKSIRERWEPELDQLVEKISEGFSHNFQKIGCAGQVSIYKDEDEFENWSIQIQVRFRENEQLSILDSQRQSGGERAVSTIFYLMALQSLARSPFRVVDEINQGMDPRNERMVHERMVDIACAEHTSQYFLITPKLLNDLKFHPKMRVHCIASGENMPTSGYEKLDFRGLADLALRVRREGVTAG